MAKWKQAHAAWKVLDRNSDNEVSKEELMDGMVKNGISVPKEAYEKIWAAMDKDDSGAISYSEFKEYMWPKRVRTTPVKEVKEVGTAISTQQRMKNRKDPKLIKKAVDSFLKENPTYAEHINPIKGTANQY